MHYEIKYDTQDREAAEEKAIADCKQWLGKKQFNKVVQLLKGDKGQSPRHAVLFGLGMQGIQGYPAEVMADRYWTPQRELI
jgi:hypothetical protein